MTRAKDISKIVTDANLSGTLDVTGEVNLSANLNLGDNDKAIFGAGDDLQIYHDGSNSYISDQGTGGLFLQGTGNVIIEQPDGTNFIQCNSVGWVRLHYGGSNRLETTSTGIDVTGTVTADGLRVDGTQALLSLYETDTTDENTLLRSGGGDFSIRTLSDNGATVTPRFNIDHATGDISFYEDTGTTPKLFWDASAEALGIGTASPSYRLDVTGGVGISGTDTTLLTVSGVATGYVAEITNVSGAAGARDGLKVETLLSNSTTKILTAASNSTDRFVVTGDGNVGIGTSSPTHALTVQYNDQTTTAKFQNTSTSGTGIDSAQVRIESSSRDASLVIVSESSRSSFIDFGDEVSSTRGRILYAHSDDSMQILTANSEAMRIDSSGNVGIGTSSPSTILTVSSGASSASVHSYSNLEIEGSSHSALQFSGSTAAEQWIWFADDTTATPVGGITYYHGGPYMGFRVEGSERMRIDGSGNLLVGTTNTAPSVNNVAGLALLSSGQLQTTADGASAASFNRKTSDGSIINLRKDGTTEGTISVSGTTVSYNGGHLARWSRLLDNSKDISIVKGTVMTNLDEMVEWDDEDNEQLNKMAVSSVEGDANVAGVFVNWDNDDDWNDMNIAMTGDMVIRIAQGTTVARGDLLMSAGDGTAKPQGDDIVRSKTIAKVTSTNVSHTYDDGTYLVPCVLMAC